MGKANMNKFAGGESGDNPDFGKIKTPWNLDFSAGGSSGGSGAMVAAGLVPLSVGTDNGGSIRIPAALCGIVGFKPTFGRVSLDGIFPRAYTFDHAGPLTRSVEDSAIALQVLAGHDSDSETTIRKPVPDYSKALGGASTPLRVGFDRKFAEFGHPTVLDCVEKAIKKLEQLGASIREVTIPLGGGISRCRVRTGARTFIEHGGDLASASHGIHIRGRVMANGRGTCSRRGLHSRHSTAASPSKAPRAGDE